jgi:transposase
VETRLIYICERNTGLPLYFRYISGNIVDFSTLATTVEELEKAGVCTDFAILVGLITGNSRD